VKYSTSAPGTAPAAIMITWRRLLVAGVWTATRGVKFDVSVETPSKAKVELPSSQSAQSTTSTSAPT
jgi:hypothetical protein